MLPFHYHKNKVISLLNADLLNSKYIFWGKLINKITQKFLYRYESFLQFKLWQTKYRFLDFWQSKKNINNKNTFFKFWNRDKWYYNSSFFNHFDFYFKNFNKEKYFSFLFLNRDLDVFYYSPKNKSSLNFLSNIKKGLNFSNYSYRYFFLSFNQRLNYYLKSKYSSKQSLNNKIFFILDKNIQKSFNSDTNEVLRKTFKFELKKKQLFYGFNKFKNYKNFFNKFISYKKFHFYNSLLLLEGRLEFFLVRINFFPTIYFSRQYIQHSKILVNNKICINSFYQIKIGDIVSLSNKIFLFNFFLLKRLLEINFIFFNFPFYIEVDYQLLIATIIRKPFFNELFIPYNLRFNSLDYY